MLVCNQDRALEKRREEEKKKKKQRLLSIGPHASLQSGQNLKPKKLWSL